MSHAEHKMPVSGAGMDVIVKRNRKPLYIKIGAMVVLVCLTGFGLWRAMPHGLQVSASEMHIARVERGVFHDDIIVRSNVEPAISVFLDSVDGGRVEEVLVRDGAMVKAGDPLVRLSNPDRLHELVRSQSEVATQYANLSNFEAGLQTSKANYRRSLNAMRFDLEQTRKLYERNKRLADQGFISKVALDESTDKLAQQERLFKDEIENEKADIQIHEDSVKHMQQTVALLNSGLKVVSSSIAGLTVRAPITGQLTNFSLQVGESVKPSDRVGRLDDPDHFKLTASVDEYYVSRVQVGQKGQIALDGESYTVNVARTFPQIKDGRFTVELNFANRQPHGLRPGQSVDATLTLGNPAPALLLPNDAFVNDTGGAWIFVVDASGRHAERRNINIGRRSNAQIEVITGLSPGDRVIVSGYSAFAKAQQLDLGS